MIRPQKRKSMLWALGLTGLGAGIFLLQDQAAEVLPTPSTGVELSQTPAQQKTEAGASPSKFLVKPRSLDTGHVGKLFIVDKPAPEKPQKPQKPVAPPLPYLYMGKILDKGGLAVFLTRDDRAYVVHVGDVIDATYRIDAIAPPMLELTYLPLKEKQLLNIGVTK